MLRAERTVVVCHGLYRSLLLGTLLAACHRQQVVDYTDDITGCVAAQPSSVAVPTIPITGPDAQITIAGRIVGLESREPVEQAVVILGVDTVRTAADGRFRFARLPSGNHRFRVIRIGSRGYLQTLTVPSQDPREIEVRLPMALLDGPCGGIDGGRAYYKRPWWKLW